MKGMTKEKTMRIKMMKGRRRPMKEIKKNQDSRTMVVPPMTTMKRINLTHKVSVHVLLS